MAPARKGLLVQVLQALVEAVKSSYPGIPGSCTKKLSSQSQEFFIEREISGKITEIAFDADNAVICLL